MIFFLIQRPFKFILENSRTRLIKLKYEVLNASIPQNIKSKKDILTKNIIKQVVQCRSNISSQMLKSSYIHYHLFFMF